MSLISKRTLLWMSILGLLSIEWMSLLGLAVRAGHLGAVDDAIDGWMFRPSGHLRLLSQALADLGNPLAFSLLLVVLVCIGSVHIGRRLALISAVAVVATTVLVEYVAKPLFNCHEFDSFTRTFPSGHAAAAFSLAAVVCAHCALNPSLRRRLTATSRMALATGATVLALAVSLAMIVIRAHSFIDFVGSVPFAVIPTASVVYIAGRRPPRAMVTAPLPAARGAERAG